jgi:hypothetical protein
LINEIKGTGNFGLSFELDEKKIAQDCQAKSIEAEVESGFSKKLYPKEWSKQDFDRWITDKKFDSTIASILSNMNGEHLEQLYLIYKQSPDYYFQSISHNGKIELTEVIKFTNELKKLFSA